MLILISFSCIIVDKGSISQPSTILLSDLKYNVKIGDTRTYVVQTAQFLYKLFGQSFIILKNDSWEFFNLTKGVKYEVSIVNITKNESFTKEVLIRQTVIQNGSEKLISAVQTPDEGQKLSLNYALFGPFQQRLSFINYGFDTSSRAFAYYNVSKNSDNENIKILGDYIYITTSLTINYESGQINDISSSVVNWKTGWLEKTSIISIFTNGTIFSHLVIQSEDSNLLLDNQHITITIIEIGTVLIMITSAVLIWFSYRKWLKGETKKQNHESYLNYIKNKFKFSKEKAKTNQKRAGSLDHALDTINEIIEETKQDK